MFVKVIQVEEFCSFHLADGRSLQVSRLFHKVVFAKDLGLSAYPAKAVARSQDLGECAKEDDQALCIHGFQGRQALALEAQFAIRVIFDNGHFIFVDDFHEFLPSLHCPSTAGGILEIRDDIDHFYVFRGSEDFLQLFHDHAVIIRRDIDKFRLARLECV